MIRARKSAASAYLDDSNDEDGSVALTWIMGLPYTELREEERRADIFSTMWVTYRSGFPRMEPYAYTDDSGWGCMLRSAQMLMVQALQRHSLGRSWRVPRTLEERLRVPEYRRLLQLFADQPGEDSLFSIHNMCQIGIRYDKLPGEWYGPTTAACVLRDIAELYNALPIPPPPPLRQTGTTGTAARCPPQTAPPRQDKMSPVAENGDHGVVRSSNRDKNGDNGLQDRAERSNNDRVAPCACAGGADAGAAVTLAAGVASGDGQDISSVENAAGACASRSRSPSRASGERGRQVQSVRAATSGRRDGGSGTDCEGGCGIVSPESVSLRPLRVFVSQGDVVYIDEVEAMALRKGVDEGAMGISRDGVVGKGGADEGSTAGSTVEAGGSSNTDGGEQGVARSIKGDDTAGRNGLMGEEEGLVDGDQETTSDRGSSPPAFYDPLLNPGVDDSGKKEKEAWSSAVVLLVPLRLGLDELGAGYIPGLSAMLRVPQSLGFLGGRPNHATFWIGTQGDTLTGLDPHTTQAAPEMGAGFPSERYMHSLHCQHPVTMDIRRIDPSLALAFYLPDRRSFQDLTKRIRQTNPPPFSVEQTRPDYEGEMGLAFMINQRDDDGTTDDEEDEYVFVKGPER
ncbi:unnamed protein product [Sphacelaria rigidula]